jgi:putative membrane protein
VEDTKDILAKKRTALAVQRTAMGLERSIMAWLRTSLAMVGFGFTIFKFLASMQEQGLTANMRDTAPRDIGLFLVTMGVAASFFGSWEYWKGLKDLGKEFEGVKVKWFPIAATGSMGALGLLLIVRIIL